MSKLFLKIDYLQKFMSSLGIFRAGILVWAPKFCSQIYEKQFIQIAEVKVFLAIVFKHCSTFNCNLFSKNNQDCFGVMSPSVFRPQRSFDFCFLKVDAPGLRIIYIHVVYIHINFWCFIELNNWALHWKTSKFSIVQG